MGEGAFQPRVALKLAHNVANDPAEISAERQSMTRPSLASACPISTIWSSRAQRSLCPLSRRSFGRIESPFRQPTTEENHCQRRRSIARNRIARRIPPAKNQRSPNPANPQKTGVLIGPRTAHIYIHQSFMMLQS
jgi:hypothetical protein